MTVLYNILFMDISKYRSDSKLTTDTLGWGLNKALFVNFSVGKIFDLAKVPARLFESRSYLTGISAAELRRYLSNINVIFNI